MAILGATGFIGPLFGRFGVPRKSELVRLKDSGFDPHLEVELNGEHRIVVGTLFSRVL
jgi:hypothetical protein